MKLNLLQRKPYERTARRLLLASIALYGLSLWAPAMFLAHPVKALTGWKLLMLGWHGVQFGVLAWLANFLIPMGWVALYLDRPRIAHFLALGAGLLSLTTTMLFGLHSFPAPLQRSTLVAFGPGFYFWLASIGLLVLGASFGKEPIHTLELRKKKQVKGLPYWG